MTGPGPDPEPRGSLFDALRRRTVSTDLNPAVPPALRQVTAYAWRLLVVAAAIGVLVWLVIQLKLLVIPLLVAILLTALVWPAFSFLLRRRWPRWLAIVVTVLGMIAVIAGLLSLAGWQISLQLHEVQRHTVESVMQLRQYLIDGPLHVSSQQIDDALHQVGPLLEKQSEALWTGALAIGSTVGHVVTGLLLTFFILLCLLADGGGIWRWATRLFPRVAREAVAGAGQAGWRTLVSYARTQLLVATMDAIGIGVGAFLLGVPLAVPIGVLVFLGAFIPFVGAVVTGTLAVFVALVYNGPLIALFMLIVVLGVQQFESHVLHPILMGSAVKVHPLGVVLVVAGGAMVGGIAGALFAVPMAAFVNVVAVYLSTRAWEKSGGAVASDNLIWQTVPRPRGRRS